MNLLRRTILRLFRRRHLHQELEAELALHRELAREHGNPLPLGNIAILKDSILDLWRFTTIENVWRDLWFATRSLRRNPAFTVTAVLSLALAIGVNAAMFTILNAVALRPLPYNDPQRLVWITQVWKANSTDEIIFTPDFLDWRNSNRTFQSMAAYSFYTRSLTGISEPVEIRTVKASAALLLPLLGASPFIGRNFKRQEDFAGHEHEVILSHSLWQSRFAANRAILGRPIFLDGDQYMVVGILPEHFVFPGAEAVDALTPLGKDEAGELARNPARVTPVQNVIGRLKPGISVGQAREDLNAIQAHLPVPPFHPTITIKIMPLRDHLFGDTKTVGLVLVAGSLLFLLIASANVGSLSLVRLIQRDRELAIRRVLGAPRSRIVSQLVLENALLVTLACSFGLLITLGIRSALIALGPYKTGIYGNLPFDARVWMFTVGLLLFSVLVSGIIPAVRMSDVRLAETLAAGQTSITSKRHNLRLLSLVATCEIALVIALSSSAALMLKSFWNMRYKDLGFESSRVIAATLDLNAARYRDPHRQFYFIDQLSQRAASIPGIEAVAVTSASEIPPGEGHATSTVHIEGRPLPIESRHKALTRRQEVSPAYFRMLHIPLLAGRFLRSADHNGATPVVVINRQFAHRYFPHENAIGHRLQTGEADGVWYNIVGIVGDTKTSGLTTAPEPVVYTPYDQTNGDGLHELGILLQSRLPIASIVPDFRRIVHALDPEQPIASIATVDERLNASVSRPRFTASLLFAFSCAGILLALIGVYGVIACRVRSHVREIAVRQALGATPGDVITHTMWHGVRLICPGVIMGAAAALLCGRLIANLLFEVKSNDLSVLVAVCLLVAAAAACSSLLPALRASRLDPLCSLRQN